MNREVRIPAITSKECADDDQTAGLVDVLSEGLVRLGSHMLGAFVFGSAARR
jgi:hypothetical protein